MTDFELNAPGATNNPWTPVGVETADASLNSATFGAGVLDLTEKSGIWVGVGTECFELPIVPGLQSGDTLSVGMATDKSITIRVYRNGIELPRNWRGYPKWWLQRLRVWWLTRTGRLTGGGE